MRDILTVFKKELKRFFTDKRMLAALFLPGVLIFLIYTIIGNSINGIIEDQVKNTTFNVVYTDNYGKGEEPLLKYGIDGYIKQENLNNKVQYYKISPNQVDDYKAKVVEGSYDVLIVYSDDFDDLILSGTTVLNKINVSIFYNGKDSEATYIYNIISTLTNTVYQGYTQNIENGEYIKPNLSDEDSLLMKVMSIVFPIVTVSTLFSVVMTICPESIAGEKERGTLVSIILTPIKRTHIAIGKILALVVTSIASGTVGFLGIIFSLPKIMQGAGSFSLEPGLFVSLLFLIISTLVLLVCLGFIVSVFAKTIREANAYLTPFMTIFMVLAFLPALLNINSVWFAFIPIVNIACSMNLLLTGSSMATMFLLITVGVNVVLSLIVVLLAGKSFNSEKVVYSK